MKNEKLRVPKLRFKEFSGKWEEKRIEDIFDFKNGINKEKEYFGKGYPIINFTDVYHQSGMTIESIRGLVETNEKEQINYSAKKGDVFFTRTSETIHDIGMSAVLLENIEKCVFSGFVLRARAKKDVLINLFSKYCFSIQPIRKEIVTKSSFTTRALTSGRLLNKVIFRYPLSKQEQEKIASFLSSIDKKINQLSKKDELLQNYKKAMMQKIFSQKFRFKKADGSDYPKWEEKYGNKIFETVTNKNHNSDLPVLAISQEFGAIPRDMIDYQITVSEKSVSTYKIVEIGDYIISLRSFQGGIEYSNYKGICSPAYIILRPFIKVNRDFYRFYFKTERYIKLLNRNIEGIRDGKMISYKQFSDIKLPLPSLEEQTKIANFLTSLDTKISQNKKALEETQKFKKALLQKMFV